MTGRESAANPVRQFAIRMLLSAGILVAMLFIFQDQWAQLQPAPVACDDVMPLCITMPQTLPAMSLQVDGRDASYLLVGAPSDPAYESIASMLHTLRLPFTKAEAITRETLTARPVAILYTSQSAQPLGRMESLLAYVQDGGNVILAAIPGRMDTLNAFLFDAMGIISQGDWIEGTDITLEAGLLLGGEGRYASLPVRAQDIALRDTSAVLAYMQPDPLEAVPVPLIHQCVYGDGLFSVVNGPFLHSTDGIGVLAALLAAGENLLITPAINAHSLVIAADLDFQDDRQVRSAQVHAVYARDTQGIYRDILWPDTLRLLARYDLPATLTSVPTDHTDSESFAPDVSSYRMHSLASALYAAPVTLDLTAATRLPYGADSWMLYRNAADALLADVADRYGAMRHQTATALKQRVAEWARQSTVVAASGHTVSIDCGSDGGGWYLLRTPHRPMPSDGVAITELEHNVYLLELTERYGVLTLDMAPISMDRMPDMVPHRSQILPRNTERRRERM